MRKPVTAVWSARRCSGAATRGMLRVLVGGLLASAWVSAGCLEVPIPVSTCGNGMLDMSEGEQCDEGSDSATCDRDCTLPLCGDGLYNPLANEQCDEGGDDSATCDHDCTLPVCGDGHVNAVAGEVCEEGGNNSATCDYDCSLPVCGDWIENTLAGESCDDGDLDNTDACTTRCEWAQCGDGFTYAGMEACDDGNADNTDECMSWCAAPSCVDGVRNGGETDLDCGGACDGACRIGQGCESDEDCASGRCSDGQCIANRLVAGGKHTCALLESDAVRCWGYNGYGQLGYAHQRRIGNDEPPSSAGDVDVGGRVMQLAAGYSHTCALLESGAMRCWGRAVGGRLGYRSERNNIGDDEPPSSAGDVNVGSRVTQLAAGRYRTCALLESGTVRCWGRHPDGWNEYGHTDDIGDYETPSNAGDVHVGARVVQLAAGHYHTCALVEGGGVRCWGSNGSGQLGYGHTNPISDDESPGSAGDVHVGARVVQLAAGGAHTCALLEGGGVRCWGSNWQGQLGYGNTHDIGDDESPSSAGDVYLSGRAVQLTAGGTHTCALLQEGAVQCWGANGQGQLGQGHDNPIGDDERPDSMEVVGVGGRAVEITAGDEHTCALLEDGTLRCWGANWYGQLGYGHTNPIGDTELPSSVDPVSYR